MLLGVKTFLAEENYAFHKKENNVLNLKFIFTVSLRG
jgi:hypothetical protein